MPFGNLLTAKNISLGARNVLRFINKNDVYTEDSVNHLACFDDIM